MSKFRFFSKFIKFTPNAKKTKFIDPFERPSFKTERANPLKWVLFSIPITTFGLGVWQIQRREWKLGLLKAIEDKKNSEPIEFPDDLSELDNLQYTPIKVRGHFIHEKEILMGPRAYIDKGGTSASSLLTDSRKNQGWLVITPFKLKDRDETILINRGWVHKMQKNANSRPEGQIEGEIELVGVLREQENRPPFVPKNVPTKGQWLYRDVNEMATVSHTLPIWLDACGTDDMPKGWPLPNQTRINFRNEHLSYIVTWFGLSAFTSYFWYRSFVRKLPLL